ncbi:hypothetical protein DPMN_135140 [Dreissena polymorpha]|uniref:Uncharacterized protein n=1 Tax=Dreissena polymorpha TaxID=45954 RepID=A0A9D4JGI2_DREPO|nr:hypothetical protein DPMN_135140 [Dreissena polymorpha]
MLCQSWEVQQPTNCFASQQHYKLLSLSKLYSIGYLLTSEYMLMIMQTEDEAVRGRRPRGEHS